MEICLPMATQGGSEKQHEEVCDHSTRINTSVPTNSAVHLHVLEYERFQSCLPPEAWYWMLAVEKNIFTS